MIIMRHKEIVLSRLLPKTGQKTTYYSKDDGELQVGWWRGKTVNNNRPRFTQHTIFGAVTTVDNATGLEWAADGHEAGCSGGIEIEWEIALAYANLLDFAGHNDWRIPNIFELFSIIDFNRYNPAIDPTYFPNTIADAYWSSTTWKLATGNVFGVQMQEPYIYWYGKDSERLVRCVRGGL